MTPPRPALQAPVLYTACVPVLLRYLGGLVRVLDAVAALGPARAQDVLAARLAPDMLPFAAQVLTASHLALRAALPLAGRAVPAFVETPSTPHALSARVQAVMAQLQALPAADFERAPDTPVHEQAGSAPLLLPVWPFLCEFALPNVLFHVSLAYALARQAGASLGKADFDGFHAYP